MIEVVFRGRGGQGAYVASKLLAVAFHLEGKYIQSFPQFSGERRGAPVAAFLRADNREIALRCNIYTADRLVVMDETLSATWPLTQGIKGDGLILLNTSKAVDHVKLDAPYNLACVDAGQIAVEEGLGSLSQPIINTAILGAYARATQEVSLESILLAIDEGVPQKTAANKEAAKKAYDQVKLRH